MFILFTLCVSSIRNIWELMFDYHTGTNIFIDETQKVKRINTENGNKYIEKILFYVKASMQLFH